MPDHRSHGFPYEQPPRHNELAAGIAEQARASDSPKPSGQLEQGASTVPALGGRAHKGKTALSHRIQSPTLSPEDARRARTLRNALARELAATVGGGECGVAASLFLKFAAQKTAAAEAAYQAGDYETHRKLSESARMDVLYAREHAAKTAEARKASTGWVDPLAKWRKPPKEGA
jgi:hypothetical protein